jgi:hypothetical protein
MKRDEVPNQQPVHAAAGTVLALGLAMLLTLTSCQLSLRPAVAPIVQDEPQTAGVTANTTSSQTTQAQAQAAAQAYTAALAFTPSHAKPGETVQVRGSRYPAGASVDLVWYTVDGSYAVKDGTEFVGERFTPRPEVLRTVVADKDGNIQTELRVPNDYGGPHDVRGRVGGHEISQASMMIDPVFTLTPREGPVGTPIELRIDGVDSHANINTWHVLYDNHYLGFMSAVTTKGVAIARFRAAGPVGNHQISVWHNSVNAIPYLNFQQGPFKDVPVGSFTFQVTSDPGLPTQRIDDFSATDSPWPSSVQGPGKLVLTHDRGTVGQPTTLRGSNLPANAHLTLRWWTMVGNRVSSSGFSPKSIDLGDVTTGPDGTFAKDLAIPDDLGGQHRIEVVNGDKSLASTGLVIEPSLVSISPTQVRPGDEVHIHLKGVGWTTYDNTYAVTYDNSYIGYVCGFSTNGDVQFTITATGAPGTHLIDLYPTIYKGTDQQPRIYSIPQLTYASDHPQRLTPAFRLAIEVVQ